MIPVLLRNPVLKEIRAPLGRVRRWLRSRPARTQQQRETLLQETGLTFAERELLGQVETRISPDDGMYVGDGEHYYRVGLSAIDCIERAMEAAQVNIPANALDLPCGYGRVLRFLVKRFPEIRFTACDLDSRAVEFCVARLGVEPAYSQVNLDELSLGRTFDLIWCGSLITHLDDNKIVQLLNFFARHLARRGLVVFSSAGDQVAQWMINGEFDYGIDPSKIPKITSAYRADGYGYTDYPYRPDYGISLTSPDWIRAKSLKVGGLTEVYFKPHGWDNHQDVFGFIKEF